MGIEINLKYDLFMKKSGVDAFLENNLSLKLIDQS